MTKIMLENWNSKVSKNDQIYILGDFAFGKSGDADKICELLNKLNGNKFLIKGNHDHIVKNPEVRSKFGWVKDYYMLKHDGFKIVLFHYPIQVWDCKHYGSLHFYAHIHSNKLENEQSNSYNVGVDVNNYEPISLEEILKKLNCKRS